MKAKPDFKVMEICGENIVVADGESNIDFTNIISLNESATYLWNKFQGVDFTLEDMANALLEAYDIDYETALKDAKFLQKQLSDAGLIEM